MTGTPYANPESDRLTHLKSVNRDWERHLISGLAHRGSCHLEPRSTGEIAALDRGILFGFIDPLSGYHKIL